MDNAIWTRKGPKRALITGASSGIGEAFARVLAQEGWEVFLVARREEELHRVAGIVHARHDVLALTFPLDLAQPDAIDRLMERLQERGFMPDVLINNAGFGLAGPAAALPRERQLAMIDLNVRTTTDLTLRLLPHLQAQKAGGIINVASVAGFMPGPGMAVYYATKAFVLSFTEALAVELRNEGLTVSALCPGPVKTGFQAVAGMRRTSMSRLLPLASPASVARDGWQGFKEGRVIIVPGLMNKLSVFATRLLPRSVLRHMNALFTGLKALPASSIQKNIQGRKKAASTDNGNGACWQSILSSHCFNLARHQKRPMEIKTLPDHGFWHLACRKRKRVE